MFKQIKKVLVIAPHPDDETLGVGGTIKKLSKSKIDVSILVVGGHLPPIYKMEDYIQTEKECKKAVTRKLLQSTVQTNFDFECYIEAK